MPDTKDDVPTVSDTDGSAAAPSATDDALKALATLSVDPSNTGGPSTPGPAPLGVPAPAVPVPSPLASTPGLAPGMTPPMGPPGADQGAIQALGAIQTPGPAAGPPPGAGPENPYPIGQGQIGMPSTPPAQPVNPYSAKAPGAQLDPVQAAITNAAAGEDQAVAEAARAHSDLETKKVQALQEHGTAVAKTMTDYADALAREDQGNALARDALHRQAATENAAWMKDMDSAVAKEPDPGRWWENTNGFAKVMWLLSLAFSAKAMQHGATKNTALDMIRGEIDADVRDQKDRMAKQLDVLKQRGTLLAQDHSQKLADLSQDHTARVARLGVMEQALAAKANIPGASDLAVADAAGKDWVSQEKAKIAKDRYDKQVAAGESELNRRSQDRRAYMEIDARRKIAEMEDKTKRDLADEKIEARLAEKLGKGAKGDQLPIPESSGVSLVHDDGSHAQFAVPKGKSAEDASQAITDATVMHTELANLRQKLDSVSSTDFLTKSDNEFNSALASTADRMANKLGGTRGAANPGFREQMYQQLLGEDYNSFVSKIKGSREKAGQILDERIASVEQDLKQRLSSIPGSNLADLESKGYNFGFKLNSTRAGERSATTADDALAAGGAPVNYDHPGDETQYRKAKANDTLPVLPPKLQHEVRIAQDEWKAHSPESIDVLYAKAKDKIEAFRDKDAKEGTGPQADPALDQANDALTRISAEHEDAKKHAEAALLATRQDAFYGTRGQVTPEEITKIAAEHGVSGLSRKEIAELVDAVNETRAKTGDKAESIRNVMQYIPR